MKRSIVFFLALVATFCTPVFSQTVSPFMGIGNAQFFDNNGEILTSGVLYSFQAGTTTQQATYTDASGAIPNPNPIPFASGARVNIWTLSSAYYKFVLCTQNDGAFCAPSDVLFSVDQVPGNPAGVSSNTYIGTFISETPSPASSGILRLASSDGICWRNQAGTENLCIAKDANDILSWAGSSLRLPEFNCTATASNYDYICPDSTTHHLEISNNGGGYSPVPVVPIVGLAGHHASFLANGYDLQDLGGIDPITTAVTFSATPTFTATSQDQLFTLTLTGNVTSSTLDMTGMPTPSLLSFEFTQDGSGGRTFAWPANVLGAPAVGTAPLAVTLAHFLWDGTNARLVSSPGCSTQTKTGAYALQAGDCVIQASVSSGSATIQIPHATTGVLWTVTRTDTSTNVLTLQADSGSINNTASIALPISTTTKCHADGTNVWCTPVNPLMQATYIASCPTSCTFTFPIAYVRAPACVCTSINQSCTLTTAPTVTSCTFTSASNGPVSALAIGLP